MRTEKITLDEIIQTYPLLQREKIETIKETIKKDGNIDFFPPIYCRDIQGYYFIWNANPRYVSAKDWGYENMGEIKKT